MPEATSLWNYAIGARGQVKIVAPNVASDIQRKIDELGDSNGSIFIPPGTYTITSSITKSSSAKIEIWGAGRATVIKAVDGLDDDVFKITGDNTILRNLEIDGNKANQTTAGFGIHITSSNNYVERVYAHDCYQAGIKVGADYNTVLFCEAYNNRISGIHTYSGTDYSLIAYNKCYNNSGAPDSWGIMVYYNSNGNIICGNMCWGNGKWGLQVGHSGGYSTKNEIINNICFDNGTHNIEIWQQQHSIIQGNVSRNSGGLGLYVLTCLYTTIFGNIVEGSSSHGCRFDNCQFCNFVGNNIVSSQYHGLWVYRTRYSVISSNVVKLSSQAASGTYSEIFLDDDGTTFSEHNTVSSNIVESTAATYAAYGINENSASDDYNEVIGNIVKVNPLATAISLSGLNSSADHNITG